MTTHSFDNRLTPPGAQTAAACAKPSPHSTTDCPDVGRSAQVLAYVEVLDALCDLDHVARAALRLIYWHGRTQVQVAAELHLPLDTVRAAVARGMRELADRLTDPSARPSVVPEL